MIYLFKNGDSVKGSPEELAEYMRLIHPVYTITDKGVSKDMGSTYRDLTKVANEVGEAMVADADEVHLYSHRNWDDESKYAYITSIHTDDGRTYVMLKDNKGGEYDPTVEDFNRLWVKSVINGKTPMEVPFETGMADAEDKPPVFSTQHTENGVVGFDNEHNSEEVRKADRERKKMHTIDDDQLDELVHAVGTAMSTEAEHERKVKMGEVVKIDIAAGTGNVSRDDAKVCSCTNTSCEVCSPRYFVENDGTRIHVRADGSSMVLPGKISVSWNEPGKEPIEIEGMPENHPDYVKHIKEVEKLGKVLTPEDIEAAKHKPK